MKTHNEGRRLALGRKHNKQGIKDKENSSYQHCIAMGTLTHPNPFA